MAIISRIGGGGVDKSPFPTYTFTGSSVLTDDGDGNWNIRFTSSGTFNITKLGNTTVDVFLVGGGGSGTANNDYNSSGGGGFTATHKGVVLAKKTDYPIVIGAGGVGVPKGTSSGNDGGETSAFNLKAAGGYGASGAQKCGNGGCGGSVGTVAKDGGNGSGGSSTITKGKGQRTIIGPNGESGTTKEFGNESLTSDDKDYGWGGASTSGYVPRANHGDSGYGATNTNPRTCNAAAGVVIVRNHRDE